MNTKLFITRPVMTTLVMLGLLFFGIASYATLPVSYLPTVDFAVIKVTATLPGARPTSTRKRSGTSFRSAGPFGVAGQDRYWA